MSALKALVVDDNPTSRLVLRKIITDDCACEVIEAADGREALRMIEEEEPVAVFLDVEMPNLGGVETLSQIRQRWGDLPVMVITSHAEPEFVRKMMSLGVADYVLKPVKREAFGERLARLRARVPGLRPVEPVEAPAGEAQGPETAPTELQETPAASKASG